MVHLRDSADFSLFCCCFVIFFLCCGSDFLPFSQCVQEFRVIGPSKLLSIRGRNDIISKTDGYKG